MTSTWWWVTIVVVFVGLFIVLAWIDPKSKAQWNRKRWSSYDAFILSLGACVVGALLVMTWLRHESVVTANFHRQYHDRWLVRSGMHTYWLGAPMIKTPLDLFVFQEIIYETRPDVILETGTWKGGASLYFASLFDLMGTEGKVVTVDIRPEPDLPSHPRIHYFTGSSTDPDTISAMTALIDPGDKVMVVLDSDHSKEHVLNELSIYADFVTEGQYLVVEDTHLSGNPVATGKGDPMAAVQEFLAKDKRFVSDRSREKYRLTFNPRGWLRRVE